MLGLMPDFVDEVIVIDNGSSDNSLTIAKGYNAKIVIAKERGYGNALLKGLQNATGQIIAIIDGDGSYPVRMLKSLYSFMSENDLDFVSGCRFPLFDRKAMPLLNRAGNYFISFLIRSWFGINLIDSQSGMMVFKRDIVEKSAVNNRGMGLSQEIKIKCWLGRHAKCAEYRIPYSLRIGRTKFRKLIDGVKNLHDLLCLWREIKNLKNHS